MANKHQVQIDLVFQAKTQQALNNLNELGKSLNRIPQNVTIGIDNGPMQKAVESAKMLQTHLQEALNVKTGKIDLTKLNSSLQAAGTNLQTLSANLLAVPQVGRKAFIDLAKAVANAEPPAVRLNKRFSDMITTIGNTAKWKIAQGAINGITKAMGNAVKYARDMNKALSDIRIVTGASTKEMASFAKQAQVAARELNTTSTEYAKAALIFYQQGLKDDEVLKRADTVIKLANVTKQSAQEVSDQMTAIWNNFSEGSQNLEYFADVMARLGAETAASTSEIAEGLEKFAAVADTVKLSYETATAAVATIIDKTKQSADVVGTSLKTILARMEGLNLGETLEDGVTLNKYSQALRNVGVEILDVNGNIRSMDEILEATGKKWQLLSDSQQIALAQTVGGMRQYNQFIALMDNWGAVQDNISKAASSKGTLQEQQDIWSESWEAASERVTEKLNQVYDQILDDDTIITLIDTLGMLADTVGDVIDAFGGIGPMALSIAGIFSKQLFPIIGTGVAKIGNAFAVMTGKAQRDLLATQNSMRAMLSRMVESGELKESDAQEITRTEKLMMLKSKLAEHGKRLTEAQRVELERKIAIIEKIGLEAQANYELADSIQEVINAQKRKVTQNDKEYRLKTDEKVTGIYGRYAEDEANKATFKALGLKSKDEIIQALSGGTSLKQIRTKKRQLGEEIDISVFSDFSKMRAQAQGEVDQYWAEYGDSRKAVLGKVSVTDKDKFVDMASAGSQAFAGEKDRNEGAVAALSSVLQSSALSGVSQTEGDSSVSLEVSLENYEKLSQLIGTTQADSETLEVSLKEMVTILSQYKELQKSTGKDEKKSKADQKKQQQLINTAKQQAAALKSSKKAYLDAAGGADRLNKALAKLDKGGDKAAEGIADIREITREATKAAIQAKDGLDLQSEGMVKLLGATEESQQELREMGANIQDQAAATQRAKDTQNLYNQQVEETGSVFDKISGGFINFATNVTTAAGAVQGLYAGFSQLFSIWTDENASFPEKLMGSLTAILMIMPALTSAWSLMSNAVKDQNKAIGDNTKKTGENAVSKIIGAGADKVAEEAAEDHSEEIDDQSQVVQKNTAVEKVNIATKLMKAAVEKFGIAGVAIGTALAVGAIAAIAGVSAAAEKETKTLKTAAEQQQQATEASRDQANQNKETIKSYNDLMAQYKETGELSADLKTKAEELSEAYNLQGSALANLTGQYETYNTQLKEARKQELAKLQKQEKTTATNAANAMAEAMSEGTGYFEGGGMRFELDSGASGTDEDKIAFNLANNKKGKSYDEFLSTNTSGINEVDITIKDRSDPYEMQRFILAMKEYQQDIVQEAERQGINLAESEAYQSLVTQIEEAEDEFEKLNASVSSLNAAEAERLIYEIDNIDDIQNANEYSAARKTYEESITQYLKDKGYKEGTIVWQDAYDSMMNEFLTYSSSIQKFEATRNAFGDLRASYARLNQNGTSAEIDNIEKYYNDLSSEDQEVFWTLKLDASSTLDDIKEQMEDAKRKVARDEAIASFNIGQSIIQALSSDTRDWDALQEQFEELAIDTWDKFLELSQQEQIELINENSLKNAQKILSSFQEDLANEEAKRFNSADYRRYQQEQEKLIKLDNASTVATTRYEAGQAIQTALGMKVNNDDGYAHHYNMAKYLGAVAGELEKRGLTDSKQMESVPNITRMLKAVHHINAGEWSKVDTEIPELDDAIEKYYGGSSSQIGKAYAVYKKYLDVISSGGDKSTAKKHFSMTDEEALGWQESIAKGLLEGKASEGGWLLEIDTLKAESTDAKAAVSDQQTIVQNLAGRGKTTLEDFNKVKAERIANLREQYADAIQKMQAYAEAQGVNIDNYNASILAIEAMNDGIEDNIYLVRVGAIAMSTYNEGLSELVESGNDWVSVLQNSNASLSDQIKMLPAFKEAMTKFFGIQGSDFDALWGGGFFNNGNIVELIKGITLGNEQSLLDLKLEVAKAINTNDTTDALLNNLQGHNLAVGTTVEEGAFGEAGAIFNRIANALAAGVSQQAIEAMGYALEIDATSGKLLGYSVAGKGYTLEQIDMLEEASKQAAASITPYKEINDQLKRYGENLSEIEEISGRLYGQSQIQALDAQEEILEKTNKSLDSKIQAADNYMSYYRKQLEAMGIAFNDHDDIVNYTELAAGLKNSGDYDALDELNEIVEAYDEHHQERLDAEQEQLDNNRAIADLAYERLTVELETNQAVSERTQELLDFEKSLLEDNLYQMAELLTLMTDVSDNKKTSQYENIINGLADIEDYYKKLKNNSPFDENNNLKEGANIASYVEGLETAKAGVLENLGALLELKNETKEYYSNVLDAAAEEISSFTDLIDGNAEVLDHYANVMELIGKSTDYKRLGVILKGQAEIAKSQLDISKANYELFNQEAQNIKAQYEAAIGTDQEEYWKTQWLAAEQASQEAQSQMIEDTEAWLEKEKAIIENGFNEIGQVMENALTGGTSFDSITTALERAVNIQDEYLTTTNKIYETNKLMNAAQKEIDKTNNTVAKQKLAQFSNETKQLQGQAKLSQYELQIQQAKYDLLLAEIALEESQNAKSTVRLKRDASGNFGYVYTANENAVADAMQNVQDKENALYQIGLDGINDYTNKYYTTVSEMHNALTELKDKMLAGDFESEQEYYAEREKLVLYYQEKLKQYSELYGVALQTDAATVSDAWGVAFMETAPSLAEINSSLQAYLQETDELFKDWSAIGQAATAVLGSSMDDTATKVNNVTSAVGELADKLGGEDGVLDKVSELMEQFGGEEGLLATMATLSSDIDTSIGKYNTILSNINDELATLGNWNGKIPGLSNLTETVMGMSPDKLQDVITAALKQAKVIPGDIGGQDKITDKEQLAYWNQIANAMLQSGYDEITGQTNLLRSIRYGASGPHQAVNQSDVDQIELSDFIDWVWDQIYREAREKGVQPSQKVYSAMATGDYLTALREVGYRFNTGGYTGEWGPEGRWALLDQKELVLDEGDTANFLGALGLLDNIIATLDRYSMSAQLGGLLSSPNFSMSSSGVIDQNVHIEASFPGVSDRYEIEEAFNNLVNKASQYVNRK